MRILFLLAMDWTYEALILVLLWPMLFICTIASCSWDTCTIDMLVIIHERQLEKNNDTYKKLERNKKHCNKCKGKNLNYPISYMHEIFK
jgi:hypothetical protein